MILDEVSVKKLSIDELIEYIAAMRQENKWTWQKEDEILNRVAELWNEIEDDIEIDSEAEIKQLKKQIKYSKNIFETKMLNKKLNELYKKRR